jgi:mannose/fructose-specific phosphotransferase system component IIA
VTEVSGVVVAHGDLAAALIEAAERISGIEGALTAVSNVGLSPDALQTRLVQVLGDGPAILFTDLASGSCAFACRSLVRTRPALAVVTGTNLAMLIDFLFNRHQDVPALTRRVVEKGREGLTVLSPAGGLDVAGPVSD